MVVVEMMRKTLVLLIVLLVGGATKAEIERNSLKLIPSNVLFALVDKDWDRDSVEGPIEASIKAYHELELRREGSEGRFLTPLLQSLEYFEETIGYSKEKFLKNGSQRVSERISDIEQGVATLKSWALDDGVTGKASVFRLRDCQSSRDCDNCSEE